MGWAAETIARLATPRRIAMVGQDVGLVDHGALMVYTPIVAEDRQLAAMLDRLLRGGNPAEIPFELPTRAIFAINRKAAAAIGVRFPPDFTVMADRIVD
jgi:putative ABC transport system substrate-binding protein